MLNITDYQRNTNQNYNKLSPHTNQNESEKTILRMGENGRKETNDKGIISKIFQNLIQFNTRKTNEAFKK